MTQEDKLLLIRDISARLPYAVKVECTAGGFRGTLHDIKVHHIYDDNDNVCDAICYTDYFGDGDSINIKYFKPYLFPLSSMTEEQEMELNGLLSEVYDFTFRMEELLEPIQMQNIPFHYIDWFNKNHVDFRGLIEKGLAIDATGKNIY